MKLNQSTRVEGGAIAAKGRPVGVSSDYQRMKSNVPRIVALLNAVFPGGGDYFACHLVFDDAKKTIRYTGDDATTLEQSREPSPTNPARSGPRPNPATLACEALVTRLRDEKHISFHAIAKLLNNTPATIRKVYAQTKIRLRRSDNNRTD